MKVILLLVVFVILLLVNLSQNGYSQTAKGDKAIPSWIKNDVRWWSEGYISDKEYYSTIKWLAEKQVINVKTTDKEKIMDSIPVSVKTVSCLWAEDKVSDAEFLNQARYMIKHVNGDKVSDQYKPVTGNVKEIPISNNIQLFNAAVNVKGTQRDVHLELIPELSDTYKKISVWNQTKKYAMIIPVFTQTAYLEPGFYTYYRGSCDSHCLTKKIDTTSLNYVSSANAVRVLSILGYDTITDIDVDKNPEILKKYDRIIILHNEYVTKKEFDAITSHPNVIYLYPNSLYAEVKVDYEKNEITLIRGHSYPQMEILNGFDWKYDNSKQEYDTSCSNMAFTKISNGRMLNCYPEQDILSDEFLLLSIKE
ncbi:MAG: hypothetical protein ACREBB_08510 [Nitrosotalea sp.]